MTCRTDWRLVDTGPLDGPANMAVDEALLDAFDPERSTPVLRLYGWNPPALSLGRYQDPAAVLDLDRCRADGVPAVRRITGGGVIYHADELTYAIVCAPQHLPPASTVKDSFRHLTGFLLAFYRGLGLDAAWAADVAADSGRLGERTAFCFAGKEDFDILVDGAKIGGNAQRRLRHAIFQHGSIPLADRVPTGIGYLREEPAAADLAVTSLETLGITLPPEALFARLAASFSDALGATLAPSSLTPAEQAGAAALRCGKYAEHDWAFRTFPS
ncbi:MAG TPA: lipoate--protein ligase family protein [Candidatus Deferrimicrobiaceae bacterium]|jgi:lipoate-protein ligase A